MRPHRARLGLVAWLAVAACASHHEKPAGPPREPIAAPAPLSLEATADAGKNTALDLTLRLTERLAKTYSLHTTPVPFGDNASGGPCWFVTIALSASERGAARAAGTMTFDQDEPRWLSAWPVGARVERAEAHGDGIVVALRSVAVLDQPGDLFAVGMVWSPQASDIDFDVEDALAFTTHPRGAVPHAHADLAMEFKLRGVRSELRELAADEKDGRANFARGWGGAEMQRLETWQAAFVRPLPPVPLTDTRLVEEARWRATLDRIYRPIVGVTEVKDANGLSRWGHVYGPAAPGAVATSSPGGASSKTDANGVAEHFETDDSTVIATGQGNGGPRALVASGDGGSSTITMYGRENGVTVASRSTYVAAPPVAADVRFVDWGSGDRAIALVKARPPLGDDAPPRIMPLEIPRSLAWPEPPSPHRFDLALRGVKTLDEAARAIMRMPRTTPTPEEACTLLSSIVSLEALRKLATPTAFIIPFVEPGDPMSGARLPIAAISSLATIGVSPEPPHCGSYRCEGPFCELAYVPDQPYDEYWWFTPSGGSATGFRLSGLAVYTGS